MKGNYKKWLDRIKSKQDKLQDTTGKIGVGKTDNRCSYPFHNDGIDYCWGYAEKVDRNATQGEIETMCASNGGCAFWNRRP